MVVPNRQIAREQSGAKSDQVGFLIRFLKSSLVLWRTLGVGIERADIIEEIGISDWGIRISVRPLLDTLKKSLISTVPGNTTGCKEYAALKYASRNKLLLRRSEIHLPAVAKYWRYWWNQLFHTPKEALFQ